MDVLKITPRGYCHGVVEAIRMAKQAGAEHAGGPVTMIGLLVHNEHVTRELQEHGVRLVDAPDRLEGLGRVDEGGTVIFTAHGVSPAVVAEARRRGFATVDATCSDVTRTHDLTAPQGVRGRNSDNTQILDTYGWEPSITLRTGLEATYAWIHDQLLHDRVPVA